MNIEYELEHTKLELQDVCIAIPLPMGAHPSVAECDGEYNHDSRKNLLQWNLPIVDKDNKAGAMEFNVPAAIPGDFFPLLVTFTSKSSYADLKMNDVIQVDDESPVKYSSEMILYAERYEIV